MANNRQPSFASYKDTDLCTGSDLLVVTGHYRIFACRPSCCYSQLTVRMRLTNGLL
jgi:hypothetical protein